MLIELNDLLGKVGIAPNAVMIMRHRPTEPELRAVLPWLATEQHEIYNAYQSNHGEVVEKALTRARYLASFIGHEPGRAVFVGIYEVAGHSLVTEPDFWALPGNMKLREFGTRGPKDGRDSLVFDLRSTEHMAELKGRLVVEWPGIERSWWRWASRNRLPVRAIHEESLLVSVMPDWQALTLDWKQLHLLPASWRQVLAQWRGVYYIFDRSACLGYVGSACGSDNILGRWLNYAATGDGGNRLLRGRDPNQFAFSILQRTSPDLPSDEIVALEGSWKDRLHTRAPYGLNAN